MDEWKNGMKLTKYLSDNNFKNKCKSMMPNLFSTEWQIILGFTFSVGDTARAVHK